MFKDLDLLAKLVAPAPKEKDNGAPLIEVIGRTAAEDGETEEKEDFNDDEGLAGATAKLNLDQERAIFLEGEYF